MLPVISGRCSQTKANTKPAVWVECEAVYYCLGDSPPERVFNRHQRLAFSEIVSYKADPSIKWLAITGLIPEVDCVKYSFVSWEFLWGWGVGGSCWGWGVLALFLFADHRNVFETSVLFSCSVELKLCVCVGSFKHRIIIAQFKLSTFILVLL